MENEKKFARLLAAVHATCASHPDVSAFASFPTDVEPQPVRVALNGANQLLQSEGGFGPTPHAELLASIRESAMAAQWLEHYDEGDVGSDFLQRFGCYAVIGESGPFFSQALRAWIVYMPANLYYPWHEHLAEELYLVIAGRAIFRKQGGKEVVLKAGDTVFHAANQPHATETLDEPVLCLVLWRDDFEHAPVLTDPARLCSQALAAQ